jgi:hypothetical protein
MKHADRPVLPHQYRQSPCAGCRRMRRKESAEGWVSILVRRVRADDSTQLQCTTPPGGYLSLSAARERCSLALGPALSVQHTQHLSEFNSRLFKCEVS